MLVQAPISCPFSPLVLADRLLSLAKDADQAGFSASALRLVREAYQVLDPPIPDGQSRTVRRSVKG